MASREVPSVFISYSQRDQTWRELLCGRLERYRLAGRLQVLHDGDLQATRPWRLQIEAAVANSRVALMMLSTAFLNSDFIRVHEVPPLLERWSRGQLKLLSLHVDSHGGADVLYPIGSSKEMLSLVELPSLNTTPLDALEPDMREQALIEAARRIA